MLPRHSRWRARLVGCVCLFFSLLLGCTALAADFPMSLDLRHGAEGEFALVAVEEDGAGGLAFEVTLGALLMSEDAMLRRLYFNLEGEHSGLRIQTDEPDLWAHRLRHGLRERMGMGFDYRISFAPARHRHSRFHHFSRHRHDHPAMQHMTFKLVADDALSVSDLMGLALMPHGETVHMAVKVDVRRRHGHHHWKMFGGVFEPAPPPVDDSPTDPPPSGAPGDCPDPVYDIFTGELISC